MAVSGKTKKELIEENMALRSRLKELEFNEAECKKAQEESKKSKEFLDNIINTLDDPFFVKDQDHRWFMLNDTACELMGRPREELIGKSDYDLFPKEQADVFWEKDNLVFETGQTNINEEKITWYSKEYTISTKKSLYTDPVTKKKFITGTIRDITELKKIEEKLRDSEYQYRTTVNAMRDAIHVVDKCLNIILINEKFLKWAKELGLEMDRPIGRNIFDLFPFLPEKVADEYQKVLETGETLTTIETIQLAGRDIYSESRKIPVFEDGKVVKVITIIKDITTTKLTDDAIKESEEKFRSLAEQSPNMIFINKDGRIVYANNICEEITGYKKEELCSPDFNFLCLIAPQSLDLIKKCYKAHLEGRDIPPYEYTIINKAGEKIEAINSSKLVHYEGGNAILGVVTDITERKQQENLTTIQRDLAIKLSSATELEDGLSLCLEAAIEASGMDCGGIYLVDEDSGAFKLAIHRGLSSEFINSVSFYDVDSENARLVLKGEPVYLVQEQLETLIEIKKSEGLRAIAVLPVFNEGRIIGCLNIASHINKQIHTWSRVALETIAAQIGSTVARLEAEKSLRESEEQLRLAIQAAQLSTWDWDMLTDKVLLGGQSNEVLGFVPNIKSMTFDCFEKSVNPDDLERIRLAVKQAIDGRTKYDEEYRILRSDGTERWVAVQGQPLYDKTGKAVRMIGISRDITEQKKSEESLRKSEELARACLNATNDMVYLVDTFNNVLTVNDNAARRLGKTTDELIGKNVLSYFHPDVAKSRKEHGDEVIRSGKQVRFRDEREEKFYDISIYPTFDSQRKVDRLAVFVTDITESRRAEEAMKKSTFIINSTTDAVVTTDIAGNVTFWNKGAEKIFGYRTEEIIGRPVSILYKEKDLQVLEAMIESLLDGKELSGLEITCIDKNQQDVELLLSLTSIRDEDGNITELVGITKDITELKKARKSLLQSEAKFRSMFELSPYSTVLSDIKGNIIACNRQFTKLHGTKEGPDAQVGRNILEFFPEEERLRLSSSLKNKAEGRRTLDQFEYTMLREDGTKFLAEARSTVILDNDGEPQALIATAHDITERKLAEERLRQSEEKFKVLFELAPDAYYIHDLEGKIIDGNKAAEQLIGFGKEEVIGKNFLKQDLISEEDIPKEISAMVESADGKTVGPLEMTFYRKDGSKVIVETRSYPVEISGQTVVLGIARDITERRGLEETYRSLVDNSLQGLTIVQDGRMLFFNRAFSSTTGYTEQELLDASPEQIQSLVHPEDRGLVWKRHRDRLAGKPVPPRYEFRWLRKDGDIAWVEIHASLIEYQGRPAIQAAYIDITERKKAEQALRQSEERLKVLYESAPDAIFLLDLNGNFVDVNKTMERLIGYSKTELIGKSFIETGLLSSEHVIKAVTNLEKIAMGKPTGPDEFIITKKDNSSVPVDIRAFPVKIGDRMLSLAIARDMTERKMTERKLFVHQAQLKSLASELSLTEERERHRLATDLHDQISQALVFSRIKLQQLHASVCSEEIAVPLEEVCNNLDRIIQDTRTLTFDLSSPILYELGFEAAVSEWLEEQVCKKNGIKTKFTDDGRPKPLEDDIRVLLFRNVRELLVNIIKHADARNVKVSINRINNQICVCVQDDGVGFNPVEVESKAGFGIFSVRERLEQLGGHFEIESEPGRGTKILMTAPLKTDKDSKQDKIKV